jgi:biopolymer transport protein TolR
MASSTLRSARRRRAMSEINVVPYIDVMLVLLVIFMTTAAFVPTGVVDVPRVGKANTNPAAYIEVQLGKDGKLKLLTQNVTGGKTASSNSQNVASPDLAAQVQRLRASYGDLPVVIAGDGSVTYDKVMALVKLMQDQGIAKVSLLVKR